MGVVYRATDRSLDRRVALKLITPTVADDEAFRSRFLRESKMAAAIDHPNIIPIYEAGEADGAFFLAMRFVDGTDLERRLRDGPLEPRAAVAILGQIASALDAAHAAGLVHRDVKPANVLIASGQGADRSDHAYLTDFGLTKQSGSETGLTRAGGFVGTLEYIAPEQIEGKATDGRADQYALAAIAVACLSGTAPFSRDSDVALINAHLHDPPPSVHLRVPTLPREADAVVARGMAKAPDARYPDCRSFVEDLRVALGITSTHTRPMPPRHRSRDRTRPLLIVGVLALGLIAALAFMLASGGLSTPTTVPSDNLAGGSPSGSGEASPTLDVFPNAAEAALLDELPPSLSETCRRGPYNLVESEIRSATPIASITCPQDVASGANDVIVRQFEFLSGPDALFNTDSAISRIVQSGQIRPGDCATATRAGGRWGFGDDDSGAMVCLIDGQTGDAVLYWSYQDRGILVKATNRRGDREALYDFFLQARRFIAP